ncbi:hypothetical protein BRD00_10995 [Halobacteriales archaeon QS_8_69_26]|nr:MAG: hypothetical protein BRD00_10995 [Halobacteriales archaeon QS_8_69_26]
MPPSVLARAIDAGVVTGKLFARQGLRGLAVLLALASFSAAVPVGATVVYGIRPPGGITRALAREAPGTVAALRSVPELAVIPGLLLVVGLGVLYVHSVAETALVRVLRGGGPGVVRSLGVGARLFGFRVGVLVALGVALAAVGAVAGRLAGDPVTALLTAVAASGPALVALVPLALTLDVLAVEVAVPVVLGDREPERDVDHPDPPESEEWGSAAWWRQQVAADADRSGTASHGPAGGGRGSWSSGRDHLSSRGVLSVLGDLNRTATRDGRRFLATLLPRVVLELGVWIVTGAAFYLVVVFGALLSVLALGLFVFVVSALGASPWLVAGAALLVVLLTLALVAGLTATVHAPLRVYARYYGLFVFGDLDPDLDAIPERRAAARIRREADGTVDPEKNGSQGTTGGRSDDELASGDGSRSSSPATSPNDPRASDEGTLDPGETDE